MRHGSIRDKDSYVEAPETRYAKADDGVHIAYQVVGDGPVDLLWLDGARGNLEVMWEQPLPGRPRGSQSMRAVGAVKRPGQPAPGAGSV